MPLSLGDVLDTLSDPDALAIEFYVGKIHIKGEYLTTVRDHILAGNIEVIGGTSDLAQYDQWADVLSTQKKSPPADDSDRALILHECVHAMIDVYYPEGDVTRHMGELAAYLTQTTYSVRKNPASNRDGTEKWDKFWGDLYRTVRSNQLDTAAGKGARIAPDTLEGLRQQLARLPSVNYGNFSKDATEVSNGLKHTFLFKVVTEDTLATRSFSIAYETYPDPSDDYLVRTLMENYASVDVKGYGSRLRQLRHDFLRCSRSRAVELRSRFLAPNGADRVSKLFYERLSHGGRAILLRVLSLRLASAV